MHSIKEIRNKFICFHYIWKQFERQFSYLSAFSVKSFRIEAFSEVIVSQFDYSNESLLQANTVFMYALFNRYWRTVLLYLCPNEFSKSEVYFLIESQCWIVSCVYSARRRRRNFVDFALTKLLSYPYSNIARGNFAWSLIKRKLNNSTIICLNGEKDISRLTIFINRT